MLAKSVIRHFVRRISATSHCRILSTNFSLEAEWQSRHSDLAKLGLGGDYEWISAVQKKFIGGGHASAVDVDAAVCIAEQKDQVDDVVELVYKLRHSVKAAEKLESSEYALVRLLLKHQPELILTFSNDPINYGVFLNAHAACIVIDHFLNAGNIQAAARIVTWMVQQEELDSELLNVLGIYICAKWIELPIAEQTLSLCQVNEEDEVNDDDVKTFKFPYLKNEFYDEHFDITNAHHLIGKSLHWLARDTRSIDEELRKNLLFLGFVLFGKLHEASALASPNYHAAVRKLASDRLGQNEEPCADAKAILEQIGENVNIEKEISLSAIIETHLKKIQEKEEGILCENQKTLFAKWAERRHQLVKSQAQKVLLRLRQDEVHSELKELNKVEEQMSFFKNRLSWEKKANENNQIDSEAKERHSKTKSI